MKVVFSEKQRAHHPKHFLVTGVARESPEVPARIDALLSGVRNLDLEVVSPPDLGRSPAAAVHTPEYLEFLEHIHERWNALEGSGAEVVPNVHPRARAGRYPASPVGQAGYHQADMACPISAETWGAALAATHTATHAADLLRASGEPVYALCRPPGHHAFADMAGGFCFLNNAAIAAERLRRWCRRVAILDVDVHHGNGTQGIFYDRADVLTVSLHADPSGFYPFFWGHADERGEAAGLGYNLNLPLPRGTRDDAYLRALDEALRRIRSFAPHAIVLALGLDTYEGDPFVGMGISTPGFGRIASAIHALGLPTLIVQEGGYLSEALGRNLASFLGGFLGRGDAS